MNKMYKENGFLSEEGERVFKEVLDSKISVLLKQGQTEHELRLIGSLIQQRVGTAVADAVQAKRSITTKFAEMSNEQFEGYLRAKYGERWVLQTLTQEEFARLPHASTEKCNGSWWHDEYGNESFQHDDYTCCPVHDKK